MTKTTHIVMSGFIGTCLAQTEEVLSVHDTDMRPLDAMPHEGAVLHNEGLLSKKHLAVVVVTTSLEQRVQGYSHGT